jgi:hypothetical protein
VSIVLCISGVQFPVKVTNLKLADDLCQLLFFHLGLLVDLLDKIRILIVFQPANSNAYFLQKKSGTKLK